MACSATAGCLQLRGNVPLFRAQLLASTLGAHLHAQWSHLLQQLASQSPRAARQTPEPELAFVCAQAETFAYLESVKKFNVMSAMDLTRAEIVLLSLPSKYQGCGFAITAVFRLVHHHHAVSHRQVCRRSQPMNVPSHWQDSADSKAQKLSMASNPPVPQHQR